MTLTVKPYDVHTNQGMFSGMAPDRESVILMVKELMPKATIHLVNLKPEWEDQ
jgi:hypothetical protein